MRADQYYGGANENKHVPCRSSPYVAHYYICSQTNNLRDGSRISPSGTGSTSCYRGCLALPYHLCSCFSVASPSTMENPPDILLTDETSTEYLWESVRASNGDKLRMPLQPRDGSSRNGTPPPAQPALSAPGSIISSSTQSTRSSHADLVGRTNDPLIPSTAAIASVFAGGQRYWTSLVDEAVSTKGLPIGLADPSIVLEATPALPNALPISKYLAGQSVWRVSRPGFPEDEEMRHGRQQSWKLLYDKPMTCHVLHAPVQGDAKLDTAPGISILTFTL
jgi:hypothetical protein